MCEPDALGFRGYPEGFAVAIETECPTYLGNLQPKLVIPIDYDFAGTMLTPEGHIQRAVAIPFNADNLDGFGTIKAANFRAGDKTFETAHFRLPKGIIAPGRSNKLFAAFHQ